MIQQRRIIGANIRARRSVLGLTQDDLGAFIGASRQRVGCIESGDSPLDFSEVPSLAEGLQIPNPMILFEPDVFARVPLAHPKLEGLD